MKKFYSAAAFLLAALLLISAGCKDGDGMTAAERARKQIIDALTLPPGSKLRSERVEPVNDSYLLSYGTTESIDVVANFFKNMVREKGYMSASTSEVMLSYRDKEDRQITIMWFPRDPDLSEFRTVFHVSVQPLPEALKEAAPAPAAPAEGKTAPAEEAPAEPPAE